MRIGPAGLLSGAARILGVLNGIAGTVGVLSGMVGALEILSGGLGALSRLRLRGVEFADRFRARGTGIRRRPESGDRDVEQIPAERQNGDQ
ncbi:hypothetical protein [Actinoplanes regularis]|uniref:hypothetical protein n=1 Tax=Actinoplanes regularis TaxID=52697 RepID=UPI0011776268|nr:hypothetical protein [Actinoplanes regularis]